MKKLIGYIRVSTDEQGTAGNGLEAQTAAISKYAADNGYTVVEIVREVASGKLGLEDRPVLCAAVKKCLKVGAVLVVSKLDRLSREVAFISALMKTSLKFIVTQFPDADTMMLHMYAAIGEQERKMIGQRTRDALAMLIAKGIKLGNPHKEDFVAEDGQVKLGVISASKLGQAANAAKADAFAEKMRPAVERMRKDGMSYQAIADEFNTHGTKTARGGVWAAMTVRNLCQRFA